MQPAIRPLDRLPASPGAYLLKAPVLLFAALLVAAYGYILLSADRARITALIAPTVVTTVSFTLGWRIARKQPGHTIALLFLIMAYTSAAGILVSAARLRLETAPGLDAPSIRTVLLVLGHTLWLPSVYVPLFLIPLFFPTGRLLSRRWRGAVLLTLTILLLIVLVVAWRPWPWPAYGITAGRALNGIPGSEPFFDAVWAVVYALSVLAFVCVPLAMFLRFRRAQGVERDQMKWPVLAVMGLVCLVTLWLLVPELAVHDMQLGYPLTWSMAMLFPISVGLAILRHGLWDIDVLINRTLVYGSLTALIVALYVGVVSGLGALFQSQTTAISGLIAAGTIALLFQPLRDYLQRRVNRLLYGERDDPATVLTRLAQHLQSAETPDAILPNLVQTIAHTLKIPYVAIWLPGAVEQMEPVAVWGDAEQGRQAIPLTYQQEIVGHLVVAPRGGDARFDLHDQQLLETIAALTATTVRAVQLSDELQASRRRIVTAREDERRRLRRDLHDGVGPQLASQALGLEAVAQHLAANPEKAQRLLASLIAQAQEAILDVRRLVYDLRPPALDDLGLVGALRQGATRYEGGPLVFSLDVPPALPELPAAVETAAYRIAQEAMTNVVRHAQATRCTVRLFCTDGQLVVEVRDNGRGLPRPHRSGVGLHAMRERAAELNGQFLLESLPAGGTLVQARLPLLAPAA